MFDTPRRSIMARPAMLIVGALVSIGFAPGISAAENLPYPVLRAPGAAHRGSVAPAPPPSRLIRQRLVHQILHEAPTAEAEQAQPPTAPGINQPQPSPTVPTEETRQRVERLRQQLELLGDRLANQKRPPQELPAEEPVPAMPVPIPPAEVPDVDTAPSQPAETTPALETPIPTPQEETIPPTPVEVVQPPPVTESTARSTTLIKNLPVSNVDRISVADNLFAAGETVLANEVYLQVPLKEISRQEAGWVEFQIANCDRRLGKKDDAKQRYRRLVADSTLGWIQDMAKWRLNAIDEQDALIKENQRLSELLSKLEQVKNDAAKP